VRFKFVALCPTYLILPVCFDFIKYTPGVLFKFFASVVFFPLYGSFHFDCLKPAK